VLVDVTPGVNREKASAIANFVNGPETFASFDEILERTVLFNPTRTESSLRRGILHNATGRPDGTWSWRYDRFLPEGDEVVVPDFGSLWDAVDAVSVPFMLVRGADSPALVRKLALVDVTPGVNRDKASAIANFVNGPETFASFDEILERTVLFNPTRSESSLRRGILHNAAPRDDGTWSWRYDRFLPEGDEVVVPDFGSLWDAVDAVAVPFMLVRGADSPVVDDEDVAELVRRSPGVRVEVVEGAGHSIQGDQPLVLARLLADFVG
jgi:hypothetical protein